MDRGYLDFARLCRFTVAGAFFVTRAKHNTQMKRVISRACDKTSGVLSDHEVLLSGYYARKDYPMRLRRVRFKDHDTDKQLVFLTNNFVLPAATIAALYKQRWQVELFFKWIKQHLRIKAFVGESENAVKTQIWIALCVYLLVAILKKRLNLPHSLYQILQVISVNCFEKTEAFRLFEKTLPQTITSQNPNQLNLLL
jgi:IS4 transposase